MDTKKDQSKTRRSKIWDKGIKMITKTKEES